MSLSLRNLVLSSAVALSTTAVFAANETRVNVPFDFMVGQHAYHAGSYRVESDLQKSIVKLSSVNGPSQSMTWIALPGTADPNHRTVTLSFDLTGTNCVLRTVQSGALTTRNLDSKSEHKVEGTSTIGE